MPPCQAAPPRAGFFILRILYAQEGGPCHLFRKTVPPRREMPKLPKSPLLTMPPPFLPDLSGRGRRISPPGIRAFQRRPQRPFKSSFGTLGLSRRPDPEDRSSSRPHPDTGPDSLEQKPPVGGASLRRKMYCRRSPCQGSEQGTGEDISRRMPPPTRKPESSFPGLLFQRAHFPPLC